MIERIDAIKRLKQAESDVDLKAALSAILELFAHFPASGYDTHQIKAAISDQLRLLDTTDADTPRGKVVRAVTITFLLRVNPKLEDMIRLVCDLSDAFTSLQGDVADCCDPGFK